MHTICLFYSHEKLYLEYDNLTYTKRAGAFRSSPDYSDRLCVNENHTLYLDNENFWPVMKTIIEEKRNMKSSSCRQSPRAEHECTWWSLSDNDLAEYWFQFTQALPASSLELWRISYNDVTHFKNVLYGK